MTQTVISVSIAADSMDEYRRALRKLYNDAFPADPIATKSTVAEMREIIKDLKPLDTVLPVHPVVAEAIAEAAAAMAPYADPPKKRGRKSNAEKAAEAAAAQLDADAALAVKAAELVIAVVTAEDPMPKELAGETFFDIPDFLQREQPKKEAAPATIDDARKCMAELLEKKSMAAVQEALAKFGANRISALPADKYGEFCAHVSSLLGAK